MTMCHWLFLHFYLGRNLLFSVDTASLPREKRVWQDENRGTIETYEDYKAYQWPEPEQIDELYLPQYEFLAKNLPSDMMIVAGTSGGILENVMWLMGTIPFFNT